MREKRNQAIILQLMGELGPARKQCLPRSTIVSFFRFTQQLIRLTQQQQQFANVALRTRYEAVIQAQTTKFGASHPETLLVSTQCSTA